MKELISKLEEINKKFHCIITIPDFEESEYYISVKDNICTKGIRTTAGSKILEKYMPNFDATVIEKVKQKKWSIIAKTAMDEFGFGAYSQYCAFGEVLNPYDIKRVAGGSSGGAAVLTALLDDSHMAIAESTGGSISCPASFCGIIGITPTYSRISRYGLIDFANSLDKIGVMAKTIDSAESLLKTISGVDEKDQTSTSEPWKSRKIKTIGLPKEYFSEAVDSKIKKEVMKYIDSAGIDVKEITLPLTQYAVPVYYLIACSEASTNLAKFCGIKYGATEDIKGSSNDFFSEVREKYFGKEAKRRIILGTFARMAGYRDKYYIKALKIRKKIIDEYKNAFKEVDIIAGPSMPFVAPKLDDVKKMDPIKEYMADILTAPPNIAGLPHISLPYGKHEGMPVGIQLIADHFEEQTLINFAKGIK